MGAVSVNMVPEFSQDLERHVRSIYEVLSLQQDFPRYYCDKASILVSQHTGLYVVMGTFRLDRPTTNYGDMPRLEVGHLWNEDNSGAIIELTAAQFNNWLTQPILPGVLIIRPGNPVYSRYRENKDFKSRYVLPCY